MKLKFLTALFVLAFASKALAIFCPNNFNQIEIGNTMQQVVQTCGPPDYQSTYIKPVYQSQELTYYVKTNPFSQATSKLSVVIDKDQVVNITITENRNNCHPVYQANGEGETQTVCEPSVNQETRSVPSTIVCGPPISVGSNLQQVEAACGKPAFVNHGQQQADSQNTITEIRYNAAASTTLIFENGVLADRVQK